MITRAQAGIVKPNPRYALATAASSPPAASSGISPLPSSARAALRDPNWHGAMEQEFCAIQANCTWRLVDRPPGAHVIFDKWVFHHKLNPDGTFECYKARWVVRGFTQRAGIDFSETFTPVVKLATIRTVLTIAASRRWSTHQLDVSNAFLHGTLQEHVLYQQPTGFVDAARPNAVCLLDKSLYGLCQAPRAWFNRFTAFVIRIGFTPTSSDSSLFVLRRGSEIVYLLLYIDDIVLTGSSTALLQEIIRRLQAEFTVKDLGALSFFLGIDVKCNADGFYLSQQRYAEDILERAGMTNCKPAATPINAKRQASRRQTGDRRRQDLPEFGRSVAVSDCHAARPCLRCAASLPAYA
jgi:hypothetical protein